MRAAHCRSHPLLPSRRVSTMIDPVFNVLFLCTGNSPLDHGGKHPSHARSGVIQCLLSGEPSEGRDQPIRAKNHHRLRLSDRGFAVQNLERVCNTRCAEIGFRLHALRRRGGRDLSRMAGTTDDSTLGHRRPCNGHRHGYREGARVRPGISLLAEQDHGVHCSAN